MAQETIERAEQERQTAPGPTNNGHEAPPPADGNGARRGLTSVRKLIIGGIAVAAVLLGVFWGIPRWRYSRTHVATDDAFVTGNLVNVSPLIAGTLSALEVDEGAPVKRGQIIARLDDTGERASLRQARAAYAAAASQVPQAQTNLTYQQQATEAAIRRAQAAIAAQRARTSGAGQQVRLAASTVRNQVKQAQSQIRAAEAQAAQARAQAQTAQAAVAAFRQAVQTAQRGANAAAARIAASEANVARFTADEARYARLLSREAVTRQQYDVVRTNLENARAQLAADREQAAQAQSEVERARANVAQALAQQGAASKAAAAAGEQIEVAQAGLGLVRVNQAQVGIQQTNVASSVGQGSQAEADLASALAGRRQVALRRQQIATVRAQAQQARAAVTNAEVAEGHTFIHAPTDGTVVRKAANLGQSLSPGQTIVTVSQNGRVWVTANYKETQLGDVRVGQPVEIDVDAFPGRIFKGRVQSINEATGAATSLLPPENATGNFTKVVQRIPVRIQLIPAGANEDRKVARAADIANLRQGMSVTTTIDTGGKKE